MEDSLIISKDTLVVNETKAYRKAMKFVFLIISLVLCFSSVVIFNKPSSFRFFFIAPLLFLIVLYKIFYLEIDRYSPQILLISNSQVEFSLQGYTYVIPIDAIEKIEDHSFYVEGDGNKMSHWNHEFAIKLKMDSSILYISPKGEFELAGERVLEVKIYDLGLLHDEHEKVLEYLREKLKSSQA